VSNPPVINASPLIFRSRGGLIELLKLVGEKVVVPAVVAAEIRRRGPTDLTAQIIDKMIWLVVVEDVPVPRLIQACDLGPGESSVLAWAYAYPGTEMIVDDLAARRCAAALGIPARGTLGLILTAKKRGRIAAARPILETMRRSGMHLSDHVLNQALALVNE
jgi:predicted nucleic acid-binding protein